MASAEPHSDTLPINAAFEAVVNRAIELERKIAELANQQWLKSLIEAEADFAREIADARATVARNLLE